MVVEEGPWHLRGRLVRREACIAQDCGAWKLSSIFDRLPGKGVNLIITTCYRTDSTAFAMIWDVILRDVVGSSGKWS